MTAALAMLPGLTVDGFDLSSHIDPNTGVTWVFEKIDGWYSEPENRVAYTDRNSDDGVFYSPAYSKERVITITGTIAAPDRTRLLTARAAVNTLARSHTDLAQIVITDELGTRYASVQRSGAILDIPYDHSPVATQYSMVLTAPDPRIFDTVTQTRSTPMAQQGGSGIQWRGLTGTGGMLWRGTAGAGGLPWRGAANTAAPSGIMRLDNSIGTADADIRFTVRGPAQNPAISTSTDSIVYNGALSADDVLTINTGTGRVLLNGGDRRPYLGSAQFFRIPALSTLDVLFTADVQDPNALCTAEWRYSF